MSEPAAKTVYILRELFERAYDDDPSAVKTPAIHAFATIEEASVRREALETRELLRTNPFFRGDTFADWTSLSEAELRQRMHRADMRPPPLGSSAADWRSWGSSLHHLTQAQLAVLRHALDRVAFYSIEDRQICATALPTRTAFIVQRLEWGHHDDRDPPILVNDEPVRAFRFRQKAEAHLQMLEERIYYERQFNLVYWAGGLEWSTSLPPAQLLENIQKIGVPTLRVSDCGDDNWWHTLYEISPPATVRRVRALFDKVRWFTIVEVEVGP